MTIKSWNYLKEYHDEKEEIDSAIRRVLDSGTLILGENVKKFEKKFAAYCGVEYGVGVNSGTDALFLSLKALGIGHGDEVITVPNTAVPTVSAIVSAGAVPRFVDVDQETYLMNVDAVENVITSRTRCIIPVHLYGQCVNMKGLNQIALKHGLSVIEDCAQSHGAENFSRKSGSMSDMAAFSFYPTKVLGGFGDGGMIITHNEEYYKKLKRLRLYGMEEKYYSLEHGYNSRLDELHASILLSRLGRLDQYIKRRRILAEQYDQGLKDSGLVLPKTEGGNKHVYYHYVTRHPEREWIIRELEKKDIVVNISYKWPIHVMSGYQSLGYRVGDFPVSENAARELFSLPMYPSLPGDEQRIIIDSLLEILSDMPTAQVAQ